MVVTVLVVVFIVAVTVVVTVVVLCLFFTGRRFWEQWELILVVRMIVVMMCWTAEILEK